MYFIPHTFILKSVCTFKTQDVMDYNVPAEKKNKNNRNSSQNFTKKSLTTNTITTLQNITITSFLPLKMLFCSVF